MADPVSRPPRLTRAIDAFNQAMGVAATWCVLVLILLQFFIVVVIYVFRADAVVLGPFALNMVGVQELLLYLNAFIFLGGAGAALREDAHVRVDIFYHPAPAAEKDEVDLIGTLVYLLPFCALIWLAAIPFVGASWRSLEGSIDASGLPLVFILKGFILLFALTLNLQAFALLARVLARRPRREP